MSSNLKLFIISEHWSDVDKIKAKYSDDPVVQEAVAIGDVSVLKDFDAGTFEVWDLRRVSVDLAKLGVEPFVMFAEED